MIIAGMNGLGDGLFQRAFVKNLRAPVYLQTPWPELYSDIPGVHFVRSATRLRTQQKNLARQAATVWERQPSGAVRQISYGKEGIMNGMRGAFGVEPAELDLPPLPPSPVDGDYVVVRPVTIRAEWVAESRNPLPEYVARAAAVAKDAGLTVVSVADLVPGVEWALDPLPVADIQYHAGELDVLNLLSLVANARAVIGGIGWIVPAVLAARVPAFIVCGGNGGFNAPALIAGPPLDSSRVHFAIPDRFCRCTVARHNCDKRISGFEKQIAAFAAGHFHVESVARNGVRQHPADGVRGGLLAGVSAA